MRHLKVAVSTLDPVTYRHVRDDAKSHRRVRRFFTHSRPTVKVWHALLDLLKIIFFPGAKKQAIEALITGGAVRKIVRVLAQMAERAGDVPRDARLIDFGKMLGNLTTVLGNISNEQEMFLDDLRSLPGALILPN